MGRGGNNQLLIQNNKDYTIKQTEKIVNKFNRYKKALIDPAQLDLEESIEYHLEDQRNCSEQGCNNSASFCRCSQISVSFTDFDQQQFKQAIISALQQQLEKQDQQLNSFKKSKAGKRSLAQTDNQFLAAFAEHKSKLTKKEELQKKHQRRKYFSQQRVKIYGLTLKKRIAKLDKNKLDQAVLEQLIADLEISEDYFEAEISPGYYGEEFTGVEFDLETLTALTTSFENYLINSDSDSDSNNNGNSLAWYKKQYLLKNTDYSKEEVNAYLKIEEQEKKLLDNPLINQVSSQLSDIEKQFESALCPGLKAFENSN
jgi:hypothetical protein